MSLIQEVTFESLGAMRAELREWLGPESITPLRSAKYNASRDVLVSVLIHCLTEELSDVRIRAQIQALLAEFTKRSDGFSQ